MENKPEDKEWNNKALQYNQSWKKIGNHQPIKSLQQKNLACQEVAEE